MDKDLLSVDEVAAYLDVHPITVYRWCREGILPCLKIGKAWRVRRSALDEFVQRGVRSRTLVGHLQSFLTVPDHVIGVAPTPELLHRLDAAFFQVGEARGGFLIKFYTGEPSSEDELRAEFTRHGLDVERLESERRFSFTKELHPLGGRAEALRKLLEEEAREGRTVWAAFDWLTDVDLDDALRQQRELTHIVNSHHMVLATDVLEQVEDDWPIEDQRRVRQTHSGLIRLSRSHCFLGRTLELSSN